jgi:hypothetical protein
MTKQELIKIVEQKLFEMVDKKQFGYVQVNFAAGNNPVIHTHITEKVEKK